MAVTIHAQATPPVASGYVNLPVPTRAFYQVGGGQNSERMSVVAEIFNRILTPLYGPQEKAIWQIAASTDRKCFLLYEETVAVGVLVFKTVLSSEFQEFGVTDSIEIKSLFVDQSAQNSGRGLGSALIDKLREEVPRLGLKHKGMHVTVSETKKESFMFFQKKDFQIAHEWKDRYQPGIIEYLLSCPVKIAQMEEKKMGVLEVRSVQIPHDPASPRPPKFAAQLLHIIPNAHLDDIHALKKLADGTFVSGSKDNCLYKWNKLGELVKVVDEVEPTQKDDRDWVTAVHVINDEYWVSGERSGRISLWNTRGDYIKDLQLKLPKYGTHVSHEYNTRRVTCFASGLSTSKPSLFVGFPTMFDEFNFIEGRTEFSTQVHKNDWVYSVCPLRGDSILAVTAGNVDRWRKNHTGWNHQDSLIAEEQAPRGRGPKPQRPFISSLVPLNKSNDRFGVSVFDGSVKVLDVTRKTIVNHWKEHTGRVWAIENIAPNFFASSGEDRSIKFWDTRSKSSVHTIADHVGQVTAILSLDQHTLVAGTCPEDALSTHQGAQIRFYDVRR